jgi:hypothetical protein
MEEPDSDDGLFVGTGGYLPAEWNSNTTIMKDFSLDLC